MTDIIATIAAVESQQAATRQTLALLDSPDPSPESQAERLRTILAEHKWIEQEISARRAQILQTLIPIALLLPNQVYREGSYNFRIVSDAEIRKENIRTTTVREEYTPEQIADEREYLWKALCTAIIKRATQELQPPIHDPTEDLRAMIQKMEALVKATLSAISSIS